MSKRWGIASDPKLLARIAEQEMRKGRGGAQTAQAPKPMFGSEGEAAARPAKKEPSAATKRVQKVALNNQDSRRDSLHFDEGTGTLTIVLAGAELLSLNTALRLHHAKQAQLKETWFKRIQALMLLNIGVYDLWKGRALAYPLLVEEVYATCAARCLDTESVAAACKPIIDALVRTHFIPDDSLEYIAQPIPYTFRQKEASGLVLVLRPAPQPWGLISESTMEVARSIPALPE